jgi:hypothetical protein
LRGRAAPLAVSVVLIALALYAEARVQLNGDAHWILTMAERMLGGQRLYRDIIEINPPLIVWLQLPLVWLARVLAVSPALLYRVAVFAGAILSAWATARILSRAARPALLRWTPPVVLAALLLVPAGAFGQREQIITMLLLPLVALTGLRLDGAEPSRRAAVASGVAAGVAIALKPFFVLAWVLPAAARAARLRRRRLEDEDRAILLVGLAYVAAVLVAAPGFFGVVRTFGRAYAAFTPSHSIGYLLSNAATVWVLAAYVAWWVRRERGAGAGTGTGISLALALGGAFLAALLQAKGWTYHYVPAVSLSVLLGLLALAGSGYGKVARTPVQRASRALAAFLLLLAWVPLAERTASRLAPRTGLEAPGVRQLASTVRREQGARTILVLDADMTSALPWIGEAGLTERSSFPFLWVPAVVYRTRWNGNPRVALRRRAEMGRAEGAAFDAVVSDLVQHTPDLLVVETRKRNEELTGYPGGFDHLVYYGRDAGFAACFLEFRLTAVLDDYLIFRRGGAPGRKDCGDDG